jgi:hypothetical protein
VLTAVRVGFAGEEELSVESTGDGGFLVSGAGTVENRLVARAPGFGTAMRFTAGVEPPETLEVTFGLGRSATILGVLVETHGAPIAGATVSVRSAGSPPDRGADQITLRTAEERALGHQSQPVPGELQTDAGGAFRFQDLMPGPWELIVQAVGRAPLLVGDPPAPMIVTLKEGEQHDLGQIELVSGGTILGRVIDRDGEGQAGVEIRLGPAVSKSTRADEAGHFEFHELMPGRYDVRSDRDALESVDVASGETGEVVRVMGSPPLLFGVVTAGGFLVEGARVFLREADDRPIWGPMIAERTAYTDADGRYELELASVGEHRLSVTTASGTRTTVDVTLAWDQEQHIDVTFGNARLAGQVVAADGGLPVPDAVVSVQRAGKALGLVSTRGVGRTGADGRFTIPELWAGTYTLSVKASGFAPSHRGTYDLELGETLDDVVVRMEAGAALSGVVTQAGLEVVPDGMDVVLSWADDGEQAARSGTQAGLYSFGDLTAGNYVLKIAEPGEGGGLGIEIFLFEENVQLGVGESRRLDVTLPAR